VVKNEKGKREEQVVHAIGRQVGWGVSMNGRAIDVAMIRVR
jgi:hypothetical protein